MDKQDDYPFPLTILADRYGGTYSGGRFVAFHRNYEYLPEGLNGGDIEASSAYLGLSEDSYGVGDTPDAAVGDLLHKLGRGAT